VKPAVDSINEGERVREVASLPSTGGKVRGMITTLNGKEKTACLIIKFNVSTLVES
jgi:hypothetical protein